MKYKITKLRAVDNPVHGSIGYGDLEPHYEGIFIKEPIIGERFKPHLGGYITSLVTKIIDENTFETLNSVYRIDKIIDNE
jgi:hypothetical protein